MAPSVSPKCPPLPALRLLSMKIDIPVGGIQRSFEALGAESRLRCASWMRTATAT